MKALQNIKTPGRETFGNNNLSTLRKKGTIKTYVYKH